MIGSARRHEPGQPTGRDVGPPGQPSGSHFREFCPVDSWSPAVNLYHLRERVDVCVDLAGVKPQSITVEIEMNRLVIRGVRAAPQPPARSGDVMRIVTMEIDHGPFCRTVSLPESLSSGRRVPVRVEYSQGLLWVRIPMTGAR